MRLFHTHLPTSLQSWVSERISSLWSQDSIQTWQGARTQSSIGIRERHTSAKHTTTQTSKLRVWVCSTVISSWMHQLDSRPSHSAWSSTPTSAKSLEIIGRLAASAWKVALKMSDTLGCFPGMARCFSRESRTCRVSEMLHRASWVDSWPRTRQLTWKTSSKRTELSCSSSSSLASLISERRPWSSTIRTGDSTTNAFALSMTIDGSDLSYSSRAWEMRATKSLDSDSGSVSMTSRRSRLSDRFLSIYLSSTCLTRLSAWVWLLAPKSSKTRVSQIVTTRNTS